MHYNDAPAWRSQWLEIFAAILLATAFLFIAGWGLIVEQTGVADFTFSAIAVGFVVLVGVIVYRKYSWKFVIDSDHIESRHGIVARHIQSVRIKDLRNINVRQSIIQRLLGIGDVEFSSAGSGGVEVTFFGVDRPVEVRNLAQRLQGD